MLTHLKTSSSKGRAFASLAGCLSKFATVDPVKLSSSQPYHIKNLVDGQWSDSAEKYDIIDPLNGGVYMTAPNTKGEELKPFISSLKACPKSGMHNPLKSPERYNMYGKVMLKAAACLHDPDVFDFFTKIVQRVMPKSDGQAAGEVKVVRDFLENFAGDNPRFTCRGFSVSGDHTGQMSHGYRFPYGPVAIVAPFNFPIEIPVLQLMGAAMVGNKPLLKCQNTMPLPMEQFLRLLHYCGLPMSEIDLINCRGPAMSTVIDQAGVKMTQFTGSSETSEALNRITKGRMRTEDSGFDWKVLGADVSDIDYVAWQCDQDAYAMSGQKCSAQSMLIAHKNWMDAGIIEKMKQRAATRSLNDLTCSPILSHTTQQVHDHVNFLASLPGGRVLFGGRPLTNHNIPSCYGAYEPTAVFVPLETILSSPENLKKVTTELFGPVQVITEWKDGEVQMVLDVLEGMSHHLTAAVVSKDSVFLNHILSNTVNGTTYAGIRARTTGAPQNHWFGPGGDPMAAGIGTREAILQTWTYHREIISDIGSINSAWTAPKAT
eukprot:GDKJ01022657.1.p1 GENE.GDKJ01022657.1~~GDKJ01022657.1.p1  ORF type:complete len:545 (+),score=103.58 GDKJ01022657.1:25-1659(+)